MSWLGREMRTPLSNETPSNADRATALREELARRVAASSTFEKSPRLRAFLQYVCTCALENRPEAATEQQIGINVYDRPPGYNPNEDNIVRSQARLLRMKLEHYFATEGKDEPIVITIPKGRYLPVFEPRAPAEPASPATPAPVRTKRRVLLLFTASVAVVFGVVIIWLAYLLTESRTPVSQPTPVSVGSTAPLAESGATPPPDSRPVPVVPDVDAIRIAAGRTGSPYVDVWGRRWEADRYYEGGVSRPGPKHFFPPVPDEGIFKTMREANASDDPMVPQWFRYDIPLSPGTYELKLYFADPLRQPDSDERESAQNRRSFQVNMNGRPLLTGFDPIADAGWSAVDIRAFKDVTPAEDGKLHLEFSGGQRPFVNAIELTPGTPGKMMPIRIRAQATDFIDSDGTRWSGDRYYIEGRTTLYRNPETGPVVSPIYAGERHGNFSYAVPVPPGTYTVRLHFLETFFSPLIPAAGCRGVGCRVFDVTCNGVMLLENFDIVQAASGSFRPVVREFRGLRPNGQGKLLLSFSPRVNYAEVRAIEVLDEAK
ncbi:MAG: malectin domain-containing carbohydrate-binding protein [bacterium]